MRHRLLPLILLVTVVAWAQRVPAPPTAWPRASAADTGLAAAPLDAFVAAAHDGRYGAVDRVVVVRGGRLVVDETMQIDYRELSRGRRGELGCGFEACSDPAEIHAFNYLHPDHHPWYQGRRVHSLQSVTKSVAATLVGIAIGRGEITGLDARLLSFFDSYDLTGVDPRLHRATLEDLLTMRSGIEWHEQDRPLGDTNTTILLERSDDWTRFTLDQPMDAEPGTRWVYNSGGSHLMSGIVRAATGRFIDAYAEEQLFGPLGIADYHWKTTPRGYPDTEGGLYLEALDLARIGELYLRDGVWGERRILPTGWVASATARHVERVNGAGWGYGYQWWRIDHRGQEIWAALGFGDQSLLILPAHDLVGVVNAWNLFGGRREPVLASFRDALLRAAGVP